MVEIALVFLGCAAPASRQAAEPPADTGVDGASATIQEASRHGVRNRPERIEAFKDEALGMFIHWSLDVQLGAVISHNLVGADADYVNRYFEDLPKSFNPRRYDPSEWASLAKLCGFRYAVFTTKHHNGFCMFHTATTDFSVASTPYRKDITREYADAFRTAELGVGMYFSPDDFWVLRRQVIPITHPRNQDRRVLPTENRELMRHNLKQIEELYTNYGAIECLFIDGQADGIRDLAWKLQPDTLVTRGAMTTPEQRLPDQALPGPWESCFTLGTSWQFKPTNESYKTGGQLIGMLIETRAKGGNLLLNVGPDPSGAIPFEQERIIRELGLWIFINREAIYEVRPWHVTHEGDLWFVRSSKDPKSVYVFLTRIAPHDWKYAKRRQFLVKSVRATASTAISVLGDNGTVLGIRCPEHRSGPALRAGS